MKRAHWAFSATILAILSGNSPAQDSPPDAGALFQRLDKNSDGKLTSDEIPEDQARFFERLVRLGDKNSDGALTKEEFEQANKPEERPNVPLGGAGPGQGPGGGAQAMAEARQRFDMMDRNKDGKVSLAEVPEQVRDRMKPVFERAGKDELTFEEFGRAMANALRPDPADLFKRFDANSDGKLTKEEIPAEMRERLGNLFERVGKSEVTQEEFQQFMQRLRDAAGARPGQPAEGRTFGNPDEMFSRLDTNGDGKLTVDEAPERAKPMVEGLLRRAGKERDGSLTKEELVKSLQPREGERRPEGDRPRAEGDRPRDGERRPEAGAPRDGDRPRDGERRPEGDRPRDGGDRPRDGERRPEGDRVRGEGDRPRDGERRPDAGAPREGDRPRDGERRPEGDRPREGGDRPRDGERRPDGDARIPEGRGPVIFRLLDTNRDGRISKEELAKVSELFGELDRNGDGQLDPFELIGGPGGPDGRPNPPRDGEPRREGEGRRDVNLSRDANVRREAEGRDTARPAGEAGPRRPGADAPARGRPEGDQAAGRGDFFRRLDRDGDGKISKDEAPDPMKERFSMLDTNGDGFISPDELRAGAQQLGDRARPRQPEGRPEAPKRE